MTGEKILAFLRVSMYQYRSIQFMYRLYGIFRHTYSIVIISYVLFLCMHSIISARLSHQID